MAGWSQMPVFIMVLIGMLALGFALQGWFNPRRILDLWMRNAGWVLSQRWL
jgi:hypothetical protein